MRNIFEDPAGFEDGSREKSIVPPEKCRETAERLYASHEAEILRDRDSEVDGVRAYGSEGPMVIDEMLRRFPEEVLRHYWGHGVTKGDEIAQIAAAMSILENQAILGGTAPLIGGMPDAYTNGTFFVISRRGGQMDIKGDDGKPTLVVLGKNPYSGEDVIGLKIRPGAFVVNAKFYSLVGDLRGMYPNIKILYASELPDYINQEEAREE